MSLPTVQRRLSLVILFALCLGLLAACGGAPATSTSGGTSEPRESDADAPVGGTAGAPAVMATAAAVAPPPDVAVAEMLAATVAPASEAAAAPSAGGTSSDGTTSAPQRPLGQEASLKAGELDDNATFAEYLDYLQGYGSGGVRLADVSERYMIRVIDDNQRPVLDARVTIYAGEQPVFRGRTYADGRTIFLPRAFGVSDNAAEFRVVAESGAVTAETSFARGSTEPIELGLRGAATDAALRLDLLFLLDTTGSMGDELGRIQETLDSIAQRIDGFSPRPQIRYGLVAYKDHGDDYVTTQTEFTADLDQFRAALNQLSARGGGDTPEAVDEAVYDAVVRANWSEEPAVRLVFMVADAGPHADAQQQFTYLDGAREAVGRGVKIYPIAASNTDAPAEYVLRQLAQQTLGGFVFLTYQPGENGGVPGEDTTLEAGEQTYTVERLDDLIVNIVQRELAAAVGAR